MMSTSATLLATYWSDFTLCFALVLALPFALPVGAWIKRKAFRPFANEAWLQRLCVVTILVLMLIAAPLIANHVYPFHLIGAPVSDIDNDSHPYVPHGLIHHPSKQEVEQILSHD
jgi:hypothetical protein